MLRFAILYADVHSSLFFFFFNDTAPTEIYTFPYTTLFRSQRHPNHPVGGGDETVGPGAGRRHRVNLRRARRRIEHAILIRPLDGEPDLSLMKQRRVRITRLGRQRILLDAAGRGIEPAEPGGELPRVPPAAIRGDDEAVRPRCGSS